LIIFQTIFLITPTLETQILDRFQHFVEVKPANARSHYFTCICQIAFLLDWALLLLFLVTADILGALAL